MMASSSLDINDPVHVERENSQPLEGVIAYVGPVKFSEGDDWIGVRLTGASVGLGKNDGSVKGHRYFSCGPNSGVFVRHHHVQRRTLTRLEELRLKRELAAQKTSSVATPGPTARFTPPKPGTASATPSASRTPDRDSSTSGRESSSPTGTVSPTSSIAAKSRLKELRERRAELERTRGSNPPSTTGSAESSRNVSRATTPVPGDSEASGTDRDFLEIQVQDLQSKLSELQSNLNHVSSKLMEKEQENSTLQQSLSQAEQVSHEYRKEIEDLRKELKNKNQTVISVSSDRMQETVEQLQGQNSQLQQSQSELEDEVAKLQNEVANLNQELDAEREKSTAAARDLQQTKIELFSLQQQFSSLHDQAASRSTSDATHYKERAKLQAEIAALQRANHSLLTEKTELEGSLEDLTLDKEQLTEEKETLEERLEELKIDAETAQMEVEELRVELESAKESSTSTAVSGDEEAQALATQNARLREALIRLREQTSHEKVDLWRQLKAAEKQANLSLASQSELESLRASKADLEEQVGLLKETVDQGSAFESMVEDLSDRVMALEDENVALQSTIREMEDAADIAAELEEVQAEEVKALMRDLEGRDTIIRNLEEAIKMQRRREEDFQRTIINYRSTVETLKQEKNELLALQRGGEGEKSKIIATSQKALARAAQLVSDAAKARKRDAEYAFAQVERDVQRHLAERLESMLPPSVVSAELAAIKGELLLCKIVGKAFMTLEGLSASFSKTIRSGMAEIISAGESPVEQSGAAKMSDEAAQTIFRLLHETSFCTSTIEMSSELVRFLAAGHWPDMLNTEQSTELGSAFVHLLSELDVLMGDHLKILKEEGSLSPHRSNLGGFQQLIGATLNALKNIRSIDDKVLVANNWKPPAWQLFMDASIAKFNCLGASASIAAAANPDDGPDSATLLPSMLRRIMPKMEQISSEAIKTGPRMSNLDVGNEKLVKDLERTVASWKIESQNLVDSVRALFQDQSAIRSDKILACEAVAESAIRTLSLLTSSLRAADLNSQDPDSPHALSAECQDPWLGVSVLSQKIRAIDGDPEDVNFAVRASKIEQRLSVAIENEPKLELANNKVATLEKNLGARSKEIALQNARLSELEQLLAKSNIQASSSRMPATASLTEELFKFKEENRVLTDAMDVLQQQVDEYEAELRVLKDPRGFSSKGRSSRSTPVRSSSRRSSIGRPEEGVPDISPAALTALEAAVFRPALESLRREGSALKASTISKTLCELPPMSVPCLMVKHANSVMEPNKASHSDRNDHVTHMSSVLHAARASLRLERASVRVVDLSSSASARSKWRQSLWKASLAEERLREASIAAASLVSGHA